MVNGLSEKGREGFLDGSADFDTDTISAGLLDLGTADVGIKAISGATNASPIVITATSHGFSNGDIVFIDGVGGNLAANGKWKIANVTANTFELTRVDDGVNVTGSASYTSGGYAVCLGPSASGDNWDDFSAALVGSLVNLASKTVTAGVADAADVTFTAVSGNTVEAVALIKNTGTESTSRFLGLWTGKIMVTLAADAAVSATTIWVEKLPEAIASGTVLIFSNGKSATLSAQANAGARSISVNALSDAITAGHVALAPVLNSGLPVTPNGGNITVAWSSGDNRIFKL